MLQINEMHKVYSWPVHTHHVCVGCVGLWDTDGHTCWPSSNNTVECSDLTYHV